MIAPAIAVNHAALIYQHRCVFSHLTLNLPAGKWVALLGASGVGKTSLLRLIANLTSDNANVTGEVTADNGLPVSAQIAYMAQTDLLLPWLTALENACMGYTLRGNQAAHISDRAIELLHQVGLTEAIHLYPHQLSGGMRQRVALVRTLLEDKPVVLMDEPFSALDAITRHQLQALAATLLRGKTVLFITHDPAEAARLADDIYMMQGQPAELQKIATLASATPRDIDDERVIQIQKQLLAAFTS